MKENPDIFADVLLASFNDSAEKYNFPPSLKNANYIRILLFAFIYLKKVTEILRITTDQSAYILPNMSKIFEPCIFRQL